MIEPEELVAAVKSHPVIYNPFGHPKDKIKAWQAIGKSLNRKGLFFKVRIAYAWP